MLEIARAIVTVLILVFSGMTFWYQFLRTPRSDVGVNIIKREEPYSTNSGAITLGGPPIQFYNRGEMEGIIDDHDISAELVKPSTGKIFDPPQEGDFEITFRNSHVVNAGKLSPGSNEQIRPRVNIRNLNEFPEKFDITISYEFRI